MGDDIHFMEKFLVRNLLGFNREELKKNAMLLRILKDFGVYYSIYTRDSCFRFFYSLKHLVRDETDSHEHYLHPMHPLLVPGTEKKGDYIAKYRSKHWSCRKKTEY